MIKEKLMDAVKAAAADYNSGMGVNEAIAKAAEAADFNEHQSERLVEMMNTILALNQEKSASDPTGSCELASKDEVIKLLLGKGTEKSAAAPSGAFDDSDYGFYSSDPEKTNPIIEARGIGRNAIVKEASSREEIPPELDISQQSLYKVITEKIALLKSAGEAADDVVRNMRLKMERDAVKIAKAIESPYASDDMADMFKAACRSKKAVDLVSEYSTKVAESNGGMFAQAEVFDCSAVDDLLKVAEDIEGCSGQIPLYEKKRDFYLSRAEEADNSMLEILGLSKAAAKKESMADFFNQGSDAWKVNAGSSQSEPVEDNAVKEAKNLFAKLAEDIEKGAASYTTAFTVPAVPSGETMDVLYEQEGVPYAKEKILNKRREMLLDDLMSNDPIIRDADPNVVAELYKSIVMSSPRLSLDKAMVKAVLRSGVNSVALSPADAKMLVDVDKGIALSNVERLTKLDSSIKDSNIA